MKKFNFIFAFAMMVVAAASVAVVSCKKDTTGQDNAKGVAAQAFDPRQIEDMNAYLKDFKQKMQSATKGDDEALSLEDAAWHLSSLANYDFGHANVECDDVRFDTLYAQVNVTNGEILLSDLASTYEEIHTNIDKFYHSLTLDNKHFRFIDVNISEQGYITISLLTTFTSNDKLHYFEDDSYCDEYFSNSVQYTANDVAITTLTSLFNLFLAKNADTDTTCVYYVTTRTASFYCTEWYEDPSVNCPNNDHSRLYCSGREYNWPIPKEQMCYYLDSYLGLGVDNINSVGPSVISGLVYFRTATSVTSEITQQQIGNHVLVVYYGMAVINNNNDY